MKFNEYQQKIEKFIKYPKDQALVYTTLGLAGEAGEVAEKVKKLIRDHHGALTPAYAAEIIKELGDVLFYIAAMARELQYPLDTVASTNLNKLNSRLERGKINGNGDNR
jgi:NTP pyrophosphatase (non-canonical NTP hydrolase)